MKLADVIPLLADKLREGKLILFVGAGLSQGSGLPTWKKLFEPLCDKLGYPDAEDYPKVATAVIDGGIKNRLELIEYITDKIGRAKPELNENHRFLKKLPFEIIFTTNYDRLLEELYGVINLKCIYTDEEMAYFDPKSAKMQLIYLHGDINHSRHMVITEADYQEFADKHKLMLQRLKLLLQEYTFLFIGYSARDPNLLAVISRFRQLYKEDARRHFIVLPEPNRIEVTNLRTSYGIEPVILGHHRELTAFLRALVEVYENPKKEVRLAINEADTEIISLETVKAKSDELFEKEQAKHRIPADFKPKKPFNVPNEDPHFTGRESKIDMLKTALLEKQTVGVTGLFGMGGIGKTSLAKHVAHMLKRESYFKDGILWHRLEAKTLLASLHEMADAFGAYFLKDEKLNIEAKTRYFQSIIQDLDILIVLDNAEYLDNIRPLLEVLGNHPVLITSRRHLGGMVGVIDIDRLDVEKASELFIKTWRLEDREEKIKKVIDALSVYELRTLHNICSDLLGGLPLAVTIAASVLRFKKTDLLIFEKKMNDKKLDLLNDPNNVSKAEEKDRNVRLSFDFSFSQPEVEGTAQEVFSVMGIFGGEDFPKEALYKIFKEEKNVDIDEAVSLLNQLSMVRTREKQRLYLHPLLRQYALEKLPDFMGDVAYEKLSGYYVELVKNNPQALDYEWKNALFVADWCLAHAKEKDGLYLIQKIDWFLYESGKWNERENWLKKGIEIADNLEDLSYFYNLNIQLQDLYGRQGREKECGEVIDRLQVYCSKFRPLYKNISWINYSLANSLTVINLPEKSFQVNLKNLRDCLFLKTEKQTGAVYKNLGNLFNRNGLHMQALEFYMANLVIKEKIGSRENKIRAIGDIGDLYLELERYAEALDWYQRYENGAKECKNKELEAYSYQNYFFYFLNTGDHEKAGEFLGKYKDAINEFGMVFSPAKLNYHEGLLEKAKKNYKEALLLFEKAVQFYNDLKQESEKGVCYFNMGICYLKLDNIRQARENLDAAGEIFKKYEINPISRCELEAYLAVLEAKFAYDQRAVRLLNRTKNTLKKIGIKDSGEVKEIEAEIRREIGADKYDKLLKELEESNEIDETIDLGADYLHIDPAELEIISPGDGREMLLVPSGFTEAEHYAYPLYLYPFYMDKYPVTNKDYKKFIEEMDEDAPTYWKEGKVPKGMENHPVVGITYDDALAYAQWGGKDLPLQEEWEITAGIGKGFSYPWGNNAVDLRKYFMLPTPMEEEEKPEKREDKPIKKDGSAAPKLQSPLLPQDQLKASDFTTGGNDHSEILNMKIPPHSLKFNETYFLELLKNSISLTKEEKIKIVNSIPLLSKYQIDKLIHLFENESLKSKHLALKNSNKGIKSETFNKLQAGLTSPLLKDSEISENMFITGGDDHTPVLNIKIPPHQLKLDETKFLKLLASSISLAKEEKIRIVKSIPTLSQYQVDELQRICVEEQKKLAELNTTSKYRVNSVEVAKTNMEQEKLLGESNFVIKTYPVNRFAENRGCYGVSDLLGNVFEYTASLTEPGKADSPLIVKGFSWLRYARENKNDITGIEYSLTHQRWADVGFRCVKRIFRKGEEKRFIETGGKAREWQGEWFYNRAKYLFDSLSSAYFYENRETVIDKGIKYCQQVLDCSPLHKQAAYLLLRFLLPAGEKEEKDFKKIYDNSVFPILENSRERSSFNQERVEVVLSMIKEAAACKDVSVRYDKLKEILEKIDALLQAVENNLVTAGLRLTRRDTIESLDYLLKRHEENLSFFYYVSILFLGLMKIDIRALSESLEKIADIGVELLTTEIKKGKDNTAAFKVHNPGLAPLNDIFVELSNIKQPQKHDGKTIIIDQKEFKIPRLARDESCVLKTTVSSKKSGTFPIYFTLFYTNPKAEKKEQDSQKIIEKQIRVISTERKTAQKKNALLNSSTEED